ncbi:MAG: PepSY-like domain-containing protein [Flavobacterium sp.]|nr:PepSY-like domain-containing protein [Flavobacterium sp.]
MKTNQKTLFALALSCVLFSCTNNEPVSSSDPSAVASTYEIVAPGALPTTISSYIASKYAGSVTTEANLNADGTYVTYVTLAAGATAKTSNVVVKLVFTAKGVLVITKTETPVATADLLLAIKTYISTNYAGATINVAHSETGGSFDVLITAADGRKIKLNFAANGTFESARVFRINGNHHHIHANNQTPFPIADLAASIKTYISTTYAGATITSAHKESDGSFDVFITTAAGANLNLNFSATGDFVSVSSSGNNHSNHETPIAVSSLIADIKTYITTHYPAATITSAEKDWNGGFEVHITTAAGVRLELNFTAAGVFVVGSDSNNHHSAGTVSVIVNDLIVSIKAYITTNYAGATIKEAHLESDGSYDVIITTSAGARLKLNFTATGVFVSVKTV